MMALTVDDADRSSNVIPAPTLADLLQPSSCPACDYSLVGLSPSGICPECGRTYGFPEICLYGEGQGRWAGDKPRLRGVAFEWLATLPLFWLIFGGRHSSVVNSLIVSVTIFYGAIRTTLRFFLRSQNHVVQVRLSPLGARQAVRGLGPVPFVKLDELEPIRWKKIGDISFKRMKESTYRIVFTNWAQWWQLRRYYILATVSCPDAAVEPLRQQIEVWQNFRYQK